jgi:hypothetical protein
MVEIEADTDAYSTVDLRSARRQAVSSQWCVVCVLGCRLGAWLAGWGGAVVADG